MLSNNFLQKFKSQKEQVAFFNEKPIIELN